MGKTYRKHYPGRKKRDPRERSMKSNKQRRPNERRALRKEYR